MKNSNKKMNTLNGDTYDNSFFGRVTMKFSTFAYSLHFSNVVGNLGYCILVGFEHAILAFFLLITSYPTVNKTDYVDTRNIDVYKLYKHENLTFVLSCALFSIMLMIMLLSIYTLFNTKSYE